MISIKLSGVSINYMIFYVLAVSGLHMGTIYTYMVVRKSTGLEKILY